MNPLVLANTMRLIIRRGESRDLLRELRRRVHANDTSCILRRDLSVPLARRPIAKIQITVRPLEATDIPHVISERPRRWPVIREDIPTCYVATADDGSLCYMQWMVSWEQQKRLRPYFKGQLHPFHSETVLLEFAYTFEKFRGLGIMATAMAQIAEKGLEHGARWAVTYVESDNLPSLKGCANCGFRPYMLRHETWRGFHLSQSFSLLPPNSKYPFEEK